MAFTTSKAKAQTSESSSSKEGRTSIAYVNLYINLEDGTRKKIAGDLTLRMFAENPFHQDFVDAINSGEIPEDEIMDYLTVEVVPHNPIDPDAERPKFAKRPR